MDVDSEPAHSLNYLKLFLSKSLMEVLAIIVMMLLKETNPEPQFWRGIIGTSSRRCSRSPSGVQLATMLKWTALFTNIFSISTTILLIEGVLGSKTFLANTFGPNFRSQENLEARNIFGPTLFSTKKFPEEKYLGTKKLFGLQILSAKILFGPNTWLNKHNFNRVWHKWN